MSAHKIRIRSWRGAQEMTSLWAYAYPPEGAKAWWLTCYRPGCGVNRGTWAYEWDYAVSWAVNHHKNPKWYP